MCSVVGSEGKLSQSGQKICPKRYITQRGGTNGNPKAQGANHCEVTEEERELIKEKMKQIPTINLSAYGPAAGAERN